MVSQNGSEIIVHPNVESSVSGINYQLSGGSLMTLTQPTIILNSTETTIIFTQCQDNVTFTLGKLTFTITQSILMHGEYFL